MTLPPSGKESISEGKKAITCRNDPTRFILNKHLQMAFVPLMK
jgi:hypothetical protein